MSSALDDVMARHAQACDDVAEACRESIFQDKALMIAMKHKPPGEWKELQRDIEALLHKVYKMAKRGELG